METFGALIRAAPTDFDMGGPKAPMGGGGGGISI